MKKVHLASLFFIVILLATACVEGETRIMQPEDNITLMAHIQYVDDGAKKPDVGATLYVFENLDNTEQLSFVDGKLVNNNTLATLEPQQEGVANGEGLVEVQTKYGIVSVVVIQSAAYPTQHRISIHTFKGNQSMMGLGKIVFEEEKKINNIETN